MKLTINDLLTVNAGINGLMNYECSPTVGRRADHIQQAILVPIKTFEKARKDLVDKSAKRDADGKILTDGKDGVVLENPEDFKAKMQELLDDEVSVDIPTLRLDKLPEKLKGVIVCQLSKIIEDPPAEAPAN